MKRYPHMPLWVYIGLVGIKTRKVALSFSIICGLAAIFFLFVDSKGKEIIYSGIMILGSFHYFFSMRWADKNDKWLKEEEK